MIRAAALSYAIIFSLLTGLICSGVLFIASAQKRIEVLHNNSERILFDSYAAVQYGMRNLSGTDSAQVLHANGDTSLVQRKQWGAFTLIASRTFKGTVSKMRSAMIGVRRGDLAAFYLPGNSSGLKITGKTKIEGTAFVPNSLVERAYVAGKNYEFTELIFGETKTADVSLPALRTEWKNINAADFTRGSTKLTVFPKDSAFSYHSPTACFENLQPLFIDGNLSGNLIIHSFDSIYVAASARLDNIILIAPVVHFQEGFTGTAQVVAHEHIVCEKNVRLLYPSILLVNELEIKNPLAKRYILLDEGAMVLGGILLTTQSLDFRRPPFLDLKKNSVVAGLIYNSGETEAAGNIAGSLYTQQLVANVGGGSYGNHLVDAVISLKELPEDFIFPFWLQSQDGSNQKIMRWL